MRQTGLKRATTGVVIIIVIALILLGFVRALLIRHKETSLHRNGAADLSYKKVASLVITEARKTHVPALTEQGI